MEKVKVKCRFTLLSGQVLSWLGSHLALLWVVCGLCVCGWLGWMTKVAAPQSLLPPKSKSCRFAFQSLMQPQNQGRNIGPQFQLKFA